MRKWLVLALILGAFSCTDDAPRVIPKSVISRDSMPMVIARMHIFNATAQHREARKMKFQPLVLEEQQAWLDSVHISETRFDSSIRFYVQEPEEMEAIYVQAMDLLSSQAAGLQSPPDTVKKEVPEKIRLFEEAHPVLSGKAKEMLEQHKRNAEQASEAD